MKTYEELTKKEKEKVKTYWQIKGNLRIRANILIAIGYVGMFLGFPLVLSRSSYALYAGSVLTFIGLAILLTATHQIAKDDKYLKLAFGIDDAIEDIFEIKKSDVKEMKKVWTKR